MTYTYYQYMTENFNYSIPFQISASILNIEKLSSKSVGIDDIIIGKFAENNKAITLHNIVNVL